MKRALRIWPLFFMAFLMAGAVWASAAYEQPDMYLMQDGQRLPYQAPEIKENMSWAFVYGPFGDPRAASIRLLAGGRILVIDGNAALDNGPAEVATKKDTNPWTGMDPVSMSSKEVIATRFTWGYDSQGVLIFYESGTARLCFPQIWRRTNSGEMQLGGWDCAKRTDVATLQLIHQ